MSRRTLGIVLFGLLAFGCGLALAFALIHRPPEKAKGAESDVLVLENKSATLILHRKAPVEGLRISLVVSKYNAKANRIVAIRYVELDFGSKKQHVDKFRLPEAGTAELGARQESFDRIEVEGLEAFEIRDKLDATFFKTKHVHCIVIEK